MLQSLFKSMLIITMAIGFTRTSYGLISAQAMLGTDSSKIKGSAEETTFDGTSLGVAVYLDPIPLVPVGFGLGVSMPSISGKNNGLDADITGLVVDLQVMAWTPISFFGITPFAKLGYIPFGAYKMKTKVDVAGELLDTTIPMTGSGTHFAVGANYSILPLISVLFQISMRNETLEYEEFDVGGTTFKLDDDLKKSSTNLLVGVEVGI
ncbi:MAG: hypothetical protein HRU09_03930 [Oligoflexales bacterium]|nr:hypothetical protein [Oligoflexales bacterium]